MRQKNSILAAAERLAGEERTEPMAAESVEFAEQLHQVFATLNADAPATRCFVLLDPSVRDASQGAAFAAALSRASLAPTVVPWGHLKPNPAHRPLLVQLDLSTHAASTVLLETIEMAAHDRRPEMLQRGAGQRIAGWLFSAASPADLARHLSQLCIHPLPAGLPSFAGRKRLLRFFDPLVLPVLWELLDEEQREILLGPIDQWHLFAESRQTLSLQKIRRSAPAEQPSPRLALTFQQWVVVLCLDAFNLVATELGLPSHLLSKRRAVLACLGRLIWKASTAPEVAALARLALAYHTEYDRHPFVKKILEETASDGGIQALLLLPESQWERIRDELDGEGFQ